MEFLKFCGNASFWDEDLLLNNSWPEFTECFQQTALVWAPCAFLWIAAIGYLPYLYHVGSKAPGPVTCLNSAKTWESSCSANQRQESSAFAAMNLPRQDDITSSCHQHAVRSCRPLLAENNTLLPLFLWTTENFIMGHQLKEFLPVALCLIHLVSLLKDFGLPDQSNLATSIYVADGIRAATYLFAGVLVYLERRGRLVTSGVQFLFWLLNTCTDLVPFYSVIIQQDYTDDLFEFSLFFVHYAIVLLMFILQFIPEVNNLRGQFSDQEDISPELLASFPSRLTYCWAQKMMSTGFKKALESKDLFVMDPTNQSQNIVPPFQKAWKAEMERVEQLNAKRRTSNKACYDNVVYQKSADERTPLLDDQRLLRQTSKDPNQDALTSGITDNHISFRKGQPPIQTSTLQTNFNAEPSKNINGMQSRNGLAGGITLSHNSGQNPSASNKSGKGKGGIGTSVPNQDDGLVHPSLMRVLVATFWIPFFVGQFLMLLYTLLLFVNPMVLNALLDYVNNRTMRPQWQGYVLACSFFVASFASTFIGHQTNYSMMSLGMRMKSAIISAVYGKALTMSHESKRQSTVGEIVNLMSIDCQRLQDVVAFLYIIWSMPLTVAIALYQLWGILGPASLGGLGVMVLVIPVNYVIIRTNRRLQIKTMFIKDQRLKVMAEVLNGIKVLKLYAWEPAFQDKVLYHRNRELSNLKKSAYLSACTNFVWTLVPYLVTLASFAAYILTSELGYLDATKAFVSLSLFNIMRAPINMLPQVIEAAIQAGVSMKRVNKFLNWADLDPNNVIKDPKAESIITIDNGTFSWDKIMSRPTLQNINLHIPTGQLVAVVGPVGCGKSSLLAAILGEMEKVKGTVTTKDNIAYVPQEAWIQNATVRDNILFGQTMTRRRYDQVIQACALESDLKILVGGDMTEIGEKGINLSGGQKQRVSLARAVYSNADTYLLDDPLSAVDSHVGKHIFQHVIGHQGVLAKKTRLLVTHGVHWLPMVDQIIVMSDGCISEMGSYEELLSKDGAFATFLRTYLNTGHDSGDEPEDEDPDIRKLKVGILERLASITSDTSGDERRDLDGSWRKRSSRRRGLSESEKSPKDIITKPSFKKKEIVSKLIAEEQSMTGGVKMSVYLSYLQALGRVAWVFILGLYTMFQASSLVSSIWLSEWTDDTTLANISIAGTPEYNDVNAMYLGVYGALGVCQAIFILCFSTLFNTRMVRATGNMHADMLLNILRAPSTFFDTMPVGRILNRFARDVDVMDVNLPMSVRTTIQGIGNLTTTLILIAYSSPLFLSVVLPLGALYKLIQLFYINTSRQLKRLESTTRSPVYTHFTETIQGATSIRAYGAQPKFIQESQKRVDQNLVCYFAFVVSQRWLGVRLEILGSIVTLAAALFAVINTSLSSGLVGLSVTYAMNVTLNLNFLVRVSSELESNIVSTERIKEFTEAETEAAWTNPDNIPPNNWPQEGRVQFQNFQMRYRPGLELVLRGISCDIKGGEKVGIVGRTGAGKSSLTVALFRLTEAAGGSIVIDGQTIGNIGLHDLRSRLTILPQDPVIFSGSLRLNLDPVGRHTDSELWNALQLAHLHTFVSGLPEQLDYECGEYGQNLSVGQRQLMCLARSVLRKSKILVLDEATAAVDMETDDVIQHTIRSEFKDSTVITIAHRLHTIMDYDRILVMDDGQIKEFSAPHQLLSDSSSAFYGMAKAAGLV